jgi:hypothetical protein
MTDTNLADRIDYALTAPTSAEAVDRIKTAVSDELRRLDPALEEIAWLPDFNHTYRPDMVLRWGVNRGKRERPVYLRQIAGGVAAQLDIETLSDRKPLLLGLLHHRLDPGDLTLSDSAAMIAEAVAGTTLLTDVTALDALDAQASDRSPTLATSALIRRGFGLLAPDAASELGRAVNGGYNAAIDAGDPGKIDQAAEALKPFLPSGDAERLDLQLDLLWLASGGNLEELDDGDRLLHADLKPDEWALLLEQFLTREERSERQLWSLFGQRLSLDDAAFAVGKIPNVRHLEDFVEANAGRWTARFAGLVAHHDLDRDGWWITGRTLALGRGKTSVAFTAKRSKWKKTGAPMARRSFDALRDAMRGDELLSLDAREGETSIRLSGADALPRDRVDQVVSWTNEIQGLTVITGVKDDEAKLDVSYQRGSVEADRDLALDTLRRRVLRYFDVPAADGNPDGPPEVPAPEVTSASEVDADSETA